MASPLSALRNPAFRSVWTANLAANFGTVVQTVGAGWMMTQISGSADMVALVQSATALPIMLFSAVSGAIADNFNRRRVMVTAQAFLLAVSAGLVLIAALGGITPWLLLAFTFLLGCGTALNNPAWQASIGDMVPREQIPDAVLLNSLGFNMTRGVGPAIGGGVVALGGGIAAFALNMVSYIPFMVALIRWKPSIPVSPLPRESIGLAVSAGLRYVAMSPNIIRVLLRAFVFGASAIAVLALLPLVARDILQGGPLLYGVLLGAFGLGAVCVALFSRAIREAMPVEWSIRLCFLGFMVCATTLALSPWAWLSCLALMVGGGGWMLATSFFNVSVQLSAPRWVLARALSIYQTAMFGGMTLGSWLWGLQAEVHGTANALLIAVGLMAVGLAIGFSRMRMPDSKVTNLDPLGRWQEPHLALDIKPRSGPIIISIEYDIREEDTAEFLNLMLERRRIRRRDGAHQWTLARDVEQPNLWYESFRISTWLDYVRHNHRMTHADAVVGEGIRRLHNGDAPRVHRTIERQAKWSDVTAPSKGVVEMPH